MSSRPRILVAALALTVVALGSVAAQAQGREGRYEGYALYQYASSFDTNWKARPQIKINFDSTSEWGFGMGFNWSEQLGADLELAFGQSWFTASGPVLDGVLAGSTVTLTQNADWFQGRFNVSYYLIPHRPLTPYITGGIGWNHFSTAVPGAPPQAYCAPGYYYWWCDYGYPTVSGTNFSYNVGTGLRWDAPSGSFYLKGGYQWEWVEASGLDSTPLRDGFYITLGGKF